MADQITSPGPIITEQMLRRGLERLLSAPLDLARSGARVWDSRRSPRETPQHRELFQRYVAELAPVVTEARRTWNAMVERFQEGTGDFEKARRAALMRLPAGPAFDGCFVAVIRKYWLACDALNSQVPPEERVSPQDFLLRWLIDQGYQAAVEVVAGMPYWPIGLDDEANWV
jgi:hypothetical protein